MQTVAKCCTYQKSILLQTERVKLLALASEEEMALMKKTQQLAEEVSIYSVYIRVSWDERSCMEHPI